MKTEFNGCKSFDCINLANPDLSIYKRNNQLGFDSYQCLECGAFTPILDNNSMLTLYNQISQSKNAIQAPYCPNCTKKTRTQAYGTTKSGSPRRRCCQCAHIFSLLNPATLSLKLQAMLDAITNGKTPSLLHHHLGLNSKVFYARLTQLSQLLEHVTQLLVTDIVQTENPLILHTKTKTNTVMLRSGSARQSGLKCWGLSTVDCKLGFQILNSDNLLLDNSHSKDLYQLNNVEPKHKENHSSFSSVEMTYKKIFSRHKFDDIAYAYQSETKTKEGVILRPVYVAHAHYLLLNTLISENKKFQLLLEHESFLRGSSITNFEKRVKQNQCNLYYLYASPSTPDYSNQINRKNIGWWNETWEKFTQQCQNKHWDITLCNLTNGPHPNLNSIRLDWHADFEQHFTQWLPISKQRMLSHKVYMQWHHIFTYIYNVIYCDKRKNALLKLNIDFKSIESLVGFVNYKHVSSTDADKLCNLDKQTECVCLNNSVVPCSKHF